MLIVSFGLGGMPFRKMGSGFGYCCFVGRRMVEYLMQDYGLVVLIM